MEAFLEELVIILVYSFFAIRFGFRFMDGRIAILEKPEMKIVKFIVSICVGYFLALFYFVFWVLTTLFKLFR